MKLIHAYTAAGPAYPAFVNLSQYDDGTFRLMVRSDGHNGEKSAQMNLNMAHLADFVASAQKALMPNGPVYGILDPDYAAVFSRLRCYAWSYGFACVMHGSFTRDLDVLLVPWEERASFSAVEPILKMLCEDCDMRMEDKWIEKPHGRKQRTLYFKKFGDPRWIDVSIMPTVMQPAKTYVEREEPDSI